VPLTADEATKFWPIYDQYRAEAVKLNDERWAEIKDYAANCKTQPVLPGIFASAIFREKDYSLSRLRRKQHAKEEHPTCTGCGRPIVHVQCIDVCSGV
jgi:hypothetical protein